MKKLFVPVIVMFMFAALPVYAQDSGVQKEFLLGPGDVLHISVWKDKALNREVMITPGGNISFPLAGQVKAAGKSVQELQEILSQRLGEYVPDSPVNVSLSQLNSNKIFVVGKVKKPGMYKMHGKTHVMQALALSGGFNRFAQKDEIKIIRHHKGSQKVINFDYTQVAGGEGVDSNIALQAGDTVVVP